MELKEVRSIVKGYIRKLEVTYQEEKYITKKLWRKKKDYYIKLGLKIGDLEPNYNTYNPHFHVDIAVKVILQIELLKLIFPEKDGLNYGRSQ